MSRSAEYALRAVLFIAQRPEGSPHRANEVAKALEVPRNYLQKVLHTLAKHGVLRSVRGPAGGFSLSEPPERLALRAVVDPFDSGPERRLCLLGRLDCCDDNPCSAHGQWSGVAEQVGSFFRDTTVADLLGGNGAAPIHPGGPDAVRP
ncbi:MAG TPA: Rrf2 family transcriptional regulator [Longimicrobiales bacterium]|nr:Rrf2 family transcriptional regulator [Longimicrobiales bacterium]